jgi:hypothetical protein
VLSLFAGIQPNSLHSCGVMDGAQLCTVGVDHVVKWASHGSCPTVPHSCGVADIVQLCAVGVDHAVKWVGRGSCSLVSNPPSPVDVRGWTVHSCALSGWITQGSVWVMVPVCQCPTHCPCRCGGTDGVQLCAIRVVVESVGIVLVCRCPTHHPPQLWGDRQCAAVHCWGGSCGEVGGSCSCSPVSNPLSPQLWGDRWCAAVHCWGGSCGEVCPAGDGSCLPLSDQHPPQLWGARLLSRVVYTSRTNIQSFEWRHCRASCFPKPQQYSETGRKF